MTKMLGEDEVKKVIERMRKTAEKKQELLHNEKIEIEKKPVIINKGTKIIKKKATMTTWGNKILDKGFTLVPNTLLERFSEIGITPKEMIVIMIMLRFAYYGKRPYPAEKTIAQTTGIGERSVIRIINNLKLKGYLTIQKRYIKNENGFIKRTSNIYNLSGLYRKISSLK